MKLFWQTRLVKFLLSTILRLTFPFAVCAMLANCPVAAKSQADRFTREPLTLDPVPLRVSVEPKAHAIFARATALYDASLSEGNLKGAHIIWKIRERFAGGAPYSYSGSFSFDAVGRLNLQVPYQSPKPEIVLIDGENEWSGTASSENTSAVFYRRQLMPSQAKSAVLHALSDSSLIPWNFANWFNGINRLDSEEITLQIEGRVNDEIADDLNDDISERRVIVLSSQIFRGDLCDLVRLTEIRNKSLETGGLLTEQFTYWFARSDGRLMRVQTRKTTPSKGTHPKELHISDAQITEQTLNPKFELKTFQFTLPPGAVLENLEGAGADTLFEMDNDDF